jgi:hypothetical protein
MEATALWFACPVGGSPGVVVQGDSLHILRSDLAEVVEACERGDLAEAREAAGLLLASPDALLATLARRDVSSPGVGCPLSRARGQRQLAERC